MANASLDLRRRRRVRATELLPETLASPTPDLTDVITAADAVRIGLDVLSERQRAVVVLHLVEGFSHSEIATMLGVPEGTSKSDLHIARQKVRDRLALADRFEPRGVAGNRPGAPPQLIGGGELRTHVD